MIIIIIIIVIIIMVIIIIMMIPMLATMILRRCLKGTIKKGDTVKEDTNIEETV